MPDHYFSADPRVPFARTPVRASVWGHELALSSGSGVFSRGRVDPGTCVLFRETDPPPPGRVLDLGCGYGVIGLAIAVAWSRPARSAGHDAASAGVRSAGVMRAGVASAGVASAGVVTAVDVNERAVLLANENAVALGLGDRFEAVTPDRVSAEATYDEIWSNPPIRIGKPALHDLLSTWLPRLRPEGRAVMVVGKNLGADSLQRWLTEQGYPTRRVASAKGFRVLESRRS